MTCEELYKKWYAESEKIYERIFRPQHWLAIYNTLVGCGNSLQRPESCDGPKYKDLPALWRQDADDLETGNGMPDISHLPDDIQKNILTARKVMAEVTRRCADELEAILTPE